MDDEIASPFQQQRDQFLHLTNIGGHPLIIEDLFKHLFEENAVSLSQIFKWWYKVKRLNRRKFRPKERKRRLQRRTH